MDADDCRPKSSRHEERGQAPPQGRLDLSPHAFLPSLCSFSLIVHIATSFIILCASVCWCIVCVRVLFHHPPSTVHYVGLSLCCAEPLALCYRVPRCVCASCVFSSSSDVSRLRRSVCVLRLAACAVYHSVFAHRVSSCVISLFSDDSRLRRSPFVSRRAACAVCLSVFAHRAGSCVISLFSDDSSLCRSRLCRPGSGCG